MSIPRSIPRFYTIKDVRRYEDVNYDQKHNLAVELSLTPKGPDDGESQTSKYAVVAIDDDFSSLIDLWAEFVELSRGNNVVVKERGKLPLGTTLIGCTSFQKAEETLPEVLKGGILMVGFILDNYTNERRVYGAEMAAGIPHESFPFLFSLLNLDSDIPRALRTGSSLDEIRQGFPQFEPVLRTHSHTVFFLKKRRDEELMNPFLTAVQNRVTAIETATSDEMKPAVNLEEEMTETKPGHEEQIGNQETTTIKKALSRKAKASLARHGHRVVGHSSVVRTVLKK